MKKIVILSALMLVGLTACSGNGNNSSTSKASISPSNIMTEQNYIEFMNHITNAGMSGLISNNVTFDGDEMISLTGSCAFNFRDLCMKEEQNGTQFGLPIRNSMILKDGYEYQDTGDGYVKSQTKLNDGEAKQLMDREMQGMKDVYFPITDFSLFSINTKDSTMSYEGKMDLGEGTMGDITIIYTIKHREITDVVGSIEAIEEGVKIHQGFTLTNIVAGEADVEAPEVFR